MVYHRAIEAHHEDLTHLPVSTRMSSQLSLSRVTRRQFLGRNGLFDASRPKVPLPVQVGPNGRQRILLGGHGGPARGMPTATDSSPTALGYSAPSGPIDASKALVVLGREGDGVFWRISRCDRADAQHGIILMRRFFVVVSRQRWCFDVDRRSSRRLGDGNSFKLLVPAQQAVRARSKLGALLRVPVCDRGSGGTSRW